MVHGGQHPGEHPQERLHRPGGIGLGQRRNTHLQMRPHHGIEGIGRHPLVQSVQRLGLAAAMEHQSPEVRLKEDLAPMPVVVTGTG